MLANDHPFFTFWPFAAQNSNVIRLMSPDGSVKANFIPTGATVTNFLVKDKVNYTDSSRRMWSTDHRNPNSLANSVILFSVSTT